MSRSYVLYVNGVTCVSCSASIEKAIRKAYPQKLSGFNLDLTTPGNSRRLELTLEHEKREHSVVWHEIKEIIAEAGFDSEPYEPSPPSDYQKPSHNRPLKKKRAPVRFITQLKKATSSHWALGILGCSAGLALLISFMVLGALPLAIMLPIACLSAYLTLLLGGRSIFSATKKLFKSGALTMDTLFAISTLSVLGVSIASLFVPWLPMMFEVGLLIYGFKHLGIAIENRLKKKITPGQFQDRAPKVVKEITKHGLEEKELSRVKPGDILLIDCGSIIPVDGVCEEDCTIYTTIITGATLPRRFKKGTKILAGMRLAQQSTALKMRIEKSSKDSYLAKLDAGIAQSLLEKAPIQAKTEKILTYFIPSVLLFALLSFLFISVFAPLALAIKFALSLLALACPCTLGVIVPMAVKTGMHKAAEHGVQFKNPKILQQASKTDVVLLDLHGTATTGIPCVKNYAVLEGTGLSTAQFFEIASALEQESSHPIGKAIYSFAKDKGTEQQKIRLQHPKHHAGETGQIGGMDYAIGSQSLMSEQGISTLAVDQQIKLAAGDSLIYVARNKVLIGYFIITEPLRKGVLHTVRSLMALGLKVHLCTGADEQTARRYANTLGIQNIHANCVGTSTTEQHRSKPAYIKLLQRQGHKVAMVGDGANDAHALAICDFGIAVASQEGDERTQQEAGAVIQNGSLLPLVSAFVVSKQTVRIIKQNLILSLIYNVGSVLISGGLLIGLGLALNPAVGAALMVLQACIILLNVLRFRKQALPHLKNNAAEDALEPKSSSHQYLRQKMPKSSAELRKAHSANEPKYFKQSYTPLWQATQNKEELTSIEIKKFLTK